MSRKANIANLTIEYLTFTEKELEAISRSIGRARGLTTLSLPNCSISTPALNILLPGLMSNRCLSVLSLANNLLTDECGYPLGKVISTQGSLKDELVWLANLRSEVPKDDLNRVGKLLD